VENDQTRLIGLLRQNKKRAMEMFPESKLGISAELYEAQKKLKINDQFSNISQVPEVHVKKA
jgi:hypothetical protein